MWTININEKKTKGGSQTGSERLERCGKVLGSECTLGCAAFCLLAALLVPVSLAVGSLRSKKHAQMGRGWVMEKEFSQSYTSFPPRGQSSAAQRVEWFPLLVWCLCLPVLHVEQQGALSHEVVFPISQNERGMKGGEETGMFYPLSAQAYWQAVPLPTAPGVAVLRVWVCVGMCERVRVGAVGQGGTVDHSWIVEAFQVKLRTIL